MVIIGVDPGLNGAACAFYRADHEGPAFIADAIDLPTKEDNTKSQIDVPEFARWLRRVGAAHAFIENVSAMPSFPDKVTGVRRSMGAASSFRFGMAVGQIRATFSALGIPITLVVPRVWKKAFDLSGPKKEQSRLLALELYPAAGHYLKRKMDHQRAEAILIAHWGDRHMRTKLGLINGLARRAAIPTL